MFRCPGQDQRFWKPEDIFQVSCPACGRAVEFFKDEPRLKCRGCGEMVANPKIDLGCAEWCRYAEKCLGVSTTSRMSNIRDELIQQMKGVFGDDGKRIEHALRVLDFAEQIQATEGGNPLVVKAAAILHDVGIHEAERKYGSAAGKYQQIEGPPIAEEILRKYELGDDLLGHICKIIANHHTAKGIDTIEFRCVRDADWLANMPRQCSDMDSGRLRSFIAETFKTKKGKEIATALYAKGNK